MSKLGDVRDFYENYYNEIIWGRGIGAIAVKMTHRAMERTHRNCKYDNVLEVGAGQGQHFEFVKHRFNKYYITDIVQPSIKNRINVFTKAENVQKMSFSDSSFQRVIVTCLLHHVEKPEEALNEIRRVLVTGGNATIFLPCDPGLLVRMLRACTTARKARKLGFLGYKLMNARDHRNHFGSLLEMVNYVFKNDTVKTKFFPFIFHSWNLNTFVIINVTKN